MDHGFYPSNLEGEGLRIGIVQARFNEPVCAELLEACVAELEKLGIEGEDTLVVTVPGALEIPLALQKMAESGQFDALVAAETTKNGASSRYADAVAAGAEIVGEGRNEAYPPTHC